MSVRKVDPITGKLIEDGDDVVGNVLPFVTSKSGEKCCECGSELTINDSLAEITAMLERGEVRSLAIVCITGDDLATILYEHGAGMADSARALLGLEVLKARIVGMCSPDEEDEEGA